MGRWLTADPPVKASDPAFLKRPWDLHPYPYVRQNPPLLLLRGKEFGGTITQDQDMKMAKDFALEKGASSSTAPSPAGGSSVTSRTGSAARSTRRTSGTRTRSPRPLICPSSWVEARRHEA
jgi:hypothetical protein